ncbi:MAG TPA: hypothetical protein VE266_05425 [Steroidobacteraceae bacterium]|nr:hypothetical protein [Steroidobacteraceae bacterium]
MGKLRFVRVTGFACVGLLLLAACGREGQNEMSWARAALERNKALEVVAADQQTRTFTVRLRESGELRTVRADEVVASLASAPPAAVAAAARQNQQPGAAAGAAAEPAVAQADTASGGETAAPAPAAVTRPDPVLTSETSTDLAKVAPGRVLESGPGYSIAAAQAATPGAARMRESASSAPLERRHEPIVCQGARMLHIDNRNLVFDGDAVSAMDGCEIHITNSHISASGVGVAARAANVHIDNSQIEGEQASIDVSQGAQVYAASSRFKGLSRRLDTATVHDLGGNIWN